jgi:hypothetical protein
MSKTILRQFIWPCSFRGEEFFLKFANQKQDRDEMHNRYREPFIDSSYQASAYLAKGFQRRRLKCEKFTDGWRTTMDGRRTPSDGNSSRYRLQGELKMVIFNRFARSANMVLLKWNSECVEEKGYIVNVINSLNNYL